MPATRSRTSTEQPEAAHEDVKSSDTDQQNEEESVEKSALDRDGEDVNNENSTSTTFEDKEVEESEDNDNDNDSNEVKDANGDQSEEKVENGSVKRKSEVGEGDVAEVGIVVADSTAVITKKAKLDADIEQSNEVEVNAANNP